MTSLLVRRILTFKISFNDRRHKLWKECITMTRSKKAKINKLTLQAPRSDSLQQVKKTTCLTLQATKMFSQIRSDHTELTKVFRRRYKVPLPILEKLQFQLLTGNRYRKCCKIGVILYDIAVIKIRCIFSLHWSRAFHVTCM